MGIFNLSKKSTLDKMFLIKKDEHEPTSRKLIISKDQDITHVLPQRSLTLNSPSSPTKI